MEPLTEKQHFWRQHVLQAQSHNGSLADYAKLHQVKATTLYYWVGVFSRATRTKKADVTATGFSAVRVSSPVPAAQYYIHLSSRLTLQCSVLPNPQWLAEFCRQLDAPA
jgi:transposase-like protein